MILLFTAPSLLPGREYPLGMKVNILISSMFKKSSFYHIVNDLIKLTFTDMELGRVKVTCSFSWLSLSMPMHSHVKLVGSLTFCLSIHREKTFELMEERLKSDNYRA